MLVRLGVSVNVRFVHDSQRAAFVAECFIAVVGAGVPCKGVGIDKDMVGGVVHIVARSQDWIGRFEIDIGQTRKGAAVDTAAGFMVGISKGGEGGGTEETVSGAQAPRTEKVLSDFILVHAVDRGYWRSVGRRDEAIVVIRLGAFELSRFAQLNQDKRVPVPGTTGHARVVMAHAVDCRKSLFSGQVRCQAVAVVRSKQVSNEKQPRGTESARGETYEKSMIFCWHCMLVT